MTREQIEQLVGRFDVAGVLTDVQSEGHGYINDTFIVTMARGSESERVVLQRVNHRVFTRPQDVMTNLRLITDHCHRKIDRDVAGSHRWRLTHIIPTKDGRDFLWDAVGDVWRCLTFIEGAVAHSRVRDSDHAEECGRAIGHFLALVSDMNPGLLKSTIPGFHDLSEYLRQFDRSPMDDPAAAEQIRFVDARRGLGGLFEWATAEGLLAKRVIHGDPRINNIMVDAVTGKATAVIDLDTCGGGFVQMDVGDAVRSICNPCGEDYRQLSDVDFRMDVFKAFMAGFMRETCGFLSPQDVEFLYPAIRILPFELGLRFLTDHLNGDCYFKVPQHGQNLHRAIGQFRLCALIEERESAIREVIAESWRGSREETGVCDVSNR